MLRAVEVRTTILAVRSVYSKVVMGMKRLGKRCANYISEIFPNVKHSIGCSSILDILRYSYSFQVFMADTDLNSFMTHA